MRQGAEELVVYPRFCQVSFETVSFRAVPNQQQPGPNIRQFFQGLCQVVDPLFRHQVPYVDNARCVGFTELSARPFERSTLKERGIRTIKNYSNRRSSHAVQLVSDITAHGCKRTSAEDCSFCCSRQPGAPPW